MPAFLHGQASRALSSGTGITWKKNSCFIKSHLNIKSLHAHPIGAATGLNPPGLNSGRRGQTAFTTEYRTPSRAVNGSLTGLLPDHFRSDKIAGVGRHPVCIFSFPFDIASDRVCHWHRNCFVARQLFKSDLQVIYCHSRYITRTIHSPARIYQRSCRIEDKKMWRPESSVLPGNILFLIV